MCEAFELNGTRAPQKRRQEALASRPPSPIRRAQGSWRAEIPCGPVTVRRAPCCGASHYPYHQETHDNSQNAQLRVGTQTPGLGPYMRWQPAFAFLNSCSRVPHHSTSARCPHCPAPRDSRHARERGAARPAAAAVDGPVDRRRAPSRTTREYSLAGGWPHRSGKQEVTVARREGASSESEGACAG